MMLHTSVSIVNTVCRDAVCRILVFLFLLAAFFPVLLRAETVYITDDLLVGLHEEKSIDSAILKVLPTGTALEVIRRDGKSVNVRDITGVRGWISNRYLISNVPDAKGNMDSSTAQKRIRALETENGSLKQQINSDKLKSGALQANLAELKNQISRNGSNQQFTDRIKLLTGKNAQLEDVIMQLQPGGKITESATGNIYYLFITSGIALLIGLLVGIIIMILRNKRRLGGLKL